MPLRSGCLGYLIILEVFKESIRAFAGSFTKSIWFKYWFFVIVIRADLFTSK